MPRGRKKKLNTESTIINNTDNLENSPKEIISENSKWKDTRTSVRETCITHDSDDDFIRFYTSETWGKNFCKRMLEEHPNECKLVFEDEEDGALEITMPEKSIKYIKFPTTRKVDEDTREELRNRAKRMQEIRKNKFSKANKTNKDKTNKDKTDENI